MLATVGHCFGYTQGRNLRPSDKITIHKHTTLIGFEWLNIRPQGPKTEEQKCILLGSYYSRFVCCFLVGSGLWESLLLRITVQFFFSYYLSSKARFRAVNVKIRITIFFVVEYFPHRSATRSSAFSWTTTVSSRQWRPPHEHWSAGP